MKTKACNPASLSDLSKMCAARLHNPILDIFISVAIIFKLRPARCILLPLISLQYLYTELQILVVKNFALIHKLQGYINWYETVSNAISSLACTVPNLLVYNNCNWFVRKLCFIIHLTEHWISSSGVVLQQWWSRHLAWKYSPVKNNIQHRVSIWSCCTQLSLLHK